MNKHARSIALCAALASSSLATGCTAAETHAGAASSTMGRATIQLPAENAQYKPGPGVEVVRKNCVACHSADYVYMQPPLTEAQWRATVAKMKNAMKAPIADGDVDTIVRYLMSQNGKT